MNDATSEPRRRRSGKVKAAAAVAMATMVPLALSTVPAEGTVVNVGAGHNITVFHNIDFVAVVGYEDTEVLTVEVIRNGNVIGTATGDARGNAVDGFGLEVNHGPTGAAQPGDCWVGGTPDIRPRDTIRVTSDSTAVVDEVVVDRINFTGRPSALPNGDIVVPFNAFRANGTAIRPGFIDSPEFRAVANPQVRFEAGPGIVVERRPGFVPGKLRVRYKSPFRPARNKPGWNQRQLRRALLGDGHAIGFGHVAVLPAEGMLVDGLTATPGPALGCEGA